MSQRRGKYFIGLILLTFLCSNNNVYADTNVNNWTDLKNQLESGTSVILDTNINTEGTIFPSGTVSINGNLYSIDGGNTYRILNNTGNLTIYDTNLIDGQASSEGGAIYNSGDLTLGILSDGVTFLGNSSINGGAIYNSNKLTIDSATFGKREGLGTTESPYTYSYGNTITTSDGWKGGGAIFNSTGTVNISGNTSFFNNNAVISDLTIVPSGGGAIYNNSGTLNIIASGADSVIFQDNSSSSGGAIFTSGATTITNALFGSVRGAGTEADPYVYSGGNTANATANYQGGGAIYNSASNLNINGNTNFYGNIANVNNAPNLNGGGAIYTNSGTVNIISDADGITFGGNEATRGGALYNNFGTINLKATLGDINFINNKATAYGGALYNFVATTNLYAQGGDIFFRNNTATTLGDSIYNDQGTLNLRAQTGNRIVFDDSVYNSTGSSIININQNDGTDYLGTVEFNNSVNGIYNPAINLYNGILKLGHTYQSDGTTPRSTGTITNNDIHLYGGTIDMMDGVVGNYINAPNLSIAKDSQVGLKFDVDLSDSTSDYFTLSNGLGNSGSGTNNGVFRIDDINVLHDATATNTSLTLFTGSNTPSSSQIIGATIDTTLYRYIVSQDSTNLGQLIFTRQSYFDRLYDAVKAPEITRTLGMSSNIDVMTNLNGMTGTNGELTVNGNGYSIDGKGYNGVIVASGQTYSINNVSGYSNFVSSMGGAIKNAGTATLTDVTFGKRTGSGTTGDPYVYSNGNTVTTSANYQGGGAIYNTGTLDILGSANFFGNSQTGTGSYRGGGAIYNYGGLTNITASSGDITFSGNTSNYGGGAIYNTGTTNITASNGDITFSENSNTGNGGAIYNYLATVKLSALGGDIIFSGNSATNFGGAIYNNGSSAIISMLADGGDIIFSGNKYSAGYYSSEAIYNAYGTINMQAAADNKIVFNDTIFSYSSGSGSTGIININKTDGTDYLGTVEFNNMVSGSSNPAINLYNGVLKLGHTYQADGTTIRSIGTITSNYVNLYGGTIDMVDNTISNYLSSSQLSLNKDSVTNLKIDINTTGGADYITAAAVCEIGSGTNAGKIKITGINILNNTSAENGVYSANVIRGALLGTTYVDTIGSFVDEYGHAYSVRYDNISGNVYLIKGSDETLNAYLTKAGNNVFNVSDTNSDSSTKVIEVTNNLGLFADDKLTINGNGYKIDGSIDGGGKYSGVNVTGTHEIDINNYDSLGLVATENTKITNFAGAKGGFINNAGTLTLKLDNVDIGERTGSGTTGDPYVYSNGNTSTTSADNQGGGAIYNSGTLNIIGNANFYGNTQTGSASYIGGGAIYNYASSFATQAAIINILSSNGNIVFSGNSSKNGGAIYNYKDPGSNGAVVNISSISGDVIFLGNSTTGNGGAIYNYLDTIKLSALGGDIIFSGNSATNVGGAICNNGSSAIISMLADGGDIIFSDNKYYGYSNSEAIYNGFGKINMQAVAGNKIVFNDTIYNYSSGSVNTGIININQTDGTDYLGTVEFNNSVLGSSSPTINLYNGVLKLGHTYQTDGTTIRSTGTITNNVLNLYGGTIDMMDGRIGNYINAPTLSIAKDSSIGLKFDVDLTNSTTDYFTLGSALVNSGTGTNNGVFRIDDINILHDATATNTSLTLFTGANTPSLSQIIGATIDTTLYRYVVSQDSSNLGQLIFTRMVLTDALYDAVKATGADRTLTVTSDINVLENINDMNVASSKLTVNGNGYSIDGKGYNGVIVASGQTYNVNNVSSYSNFVSSMGGAIKNAGTLNISNTTFLDNKVPGNGGAIYNTGTATLTDVTFGKRTGSGTTADPYVYSNGNTSETTSGYNYGGAIYNGGMLYIKGNSNFYGNKNVAANNTGGGAIANGYGGTLNIITDTGDITFVNNVLTRSNSYSVYGGAIYNSGVAYLKALAGDIIFSGNTSVNYGGAIYNGGTLNLIANGGDIIFSDNHASIYDGGDAINNGNGTVNMNAQGSSKIVVNDTIYNGYVFSTDCNININKNDGTNYSGTVEFNNAVRGYTSSNPKINLYEGVLKLGHTFQADNTTIRSVGNIENNKINLYGGTIDMEDGLFGNYINTSTLSLNKDSVTNLKLDIDALTGNSDYITASAVSQIGTGTNDGKINISDVKLLNLPTGDNLAIAASVMRGNILGATYITTMNTYTDDNGDVYEVGYDNVSGIIYFIKGSQETLNAYIVKSGERTFNVTSENSDEITKTIDITNSLSVLGGTKLTINGNGYKIDGSIEGGGNYNGLKAKGVQELNINNYDSSGTAADTNTSIRNFTGTAGGFINNTGTLTLKLDNVNFGERTGSGTTGDPYVYSAGNKVTATSSSEGGGAIYNAGTLNILGDVNFFGNSANIGSYSTGGGAIYNSGNLNISGGDITFGGNIVYTGQNTGGGAIFNYSGTTNITADVGDIVFADNKTVSTGMYSPFGGAIYNAGSGKVNITSSGKNVIFSGNNSQQGGAIYNSGGTINITAIDGDISFIKNSATSGGAIHNSSTLNIAAMGGNVIFADNSGSWGSGIYNNYYSATINMKAQTGSSVIINDQIYNYDSHANININKNDGTNYLGTVEFNNSVTGSSNPNINLYNGVLKLGHTYQSNGTTIRSTGTITNNVLNLYGGTIDMMDGRIANYINAPTLSIAKDSQIGLKFDVDLTNSTTDYFTLGSALVNSGTGTNNGVFKIDDINILHDATSDSTSVTLFTGTNTPSLSQIIGATVDTTIYRYIVTQDSSNLGKLVFSRSIRGDDLYLAVKATEASRTLDLASGISVIQDLDDMNGTNSELTVNGNSYVIDGQGYNGVIVGSDKTYNINNVSSYGNFVSSMGGAIKNAGTLNITNTLITNNTSSGDGGAIYNTGTTTLKGSSAITGNTSSGNGGAIYNEGTFKIIADTGDITVSGNSDSNGVGIYLKGGELDLNAADTRKITILDKIASEDNTSTININAGTENNTGDILLNNDMSGYTGGVNIYGGVVKLGTSGVFFGNAVDKIALNISEPATLNLQNNKIDTIYASSYTGGGNFLMDVSLADSTSDSIIADTINQTAAITISGIQLLSDNATNQSIRMFSDGVDISGLSISANTSTKRYLITKDADNSGCIYVQYLGDIGDGLIAQLEATGVRSYSQTAAQYTATLNLPNMHAVTGQTNTLEIFGQNKTFSGNSLYSLFKADTEDTSTAQGVARELIIHDAIITNAKGTEGSAVIVNGVGAQASLYNVNVSNNSSSGNGGAISVTNGASLVINGGMFSNNTAASNGGAIYIKGSATDASTLTIISNINNTVFSGNTAGSDSNSIYMAGNSILNVNNSSLASLILPEGIVASGDNNILDINKVIGTAPINGSFNISSDFSGFKGNNNYVNLYNGTLTLANAGTFFGNTGNTADYINLSIKNDSVLNLQNNKIDTIYLNSFETEGTNTLAKLDIDLTNHQADSIIATSVIGSPVLNVDTFNIISNAVTDSLFNLTSSNILLNYVGDDAYYTTDYSYEVEKDADSNTIHFISEYIGGDGLKRVLKNIGIRTYSMVLDSNGNSETYIANENLPDLNAEYADGRENRVTVYGNGGTITGAGQYSLFKMDTSSNNTERSLILNNVTLSNARAAQGSALYEKGKATVTANSVTVKNNTSTTEGGAIYLAEGAKLNIKGNSSFLNNTSSSKGGAVYMTSSDSSNKSEMNVISDTGTISFTGNKQNNTDSNAIYMAGNSTLNLNASSGKSILFNDSIASEGSGNTINVNKTDESTYGGNVIFNADMSGYINDVNLYNGTLNLIYPNSTFNTSSFTMYENATLDLRNSLIDNVNISNLQFATGTSNLSIDIDGRNQVADKISAPGATGVLNINNFNILTDSLSSKTNPILVSNTAGLDIATDPNAIYMGPIYKYFLTSSGGQSVVLNKTYSDSFNPVVYSAPVTSTVGAYANMVNTYDQAFTNSDIFMMQPSMQRLAYRIRNRYAISDVTDAQKLAIYPEMVSGPWFRPYTTFESVGLKNGPTVSSTSYGSFMGFDMPMEDARHGFQSVISAYAGYTGSNQSYDNVHIYQNGGLLGITKSYFKGNYFASLTTNISALGSSSTSSRSSADYSTLATGIAAKTGYNIELGDGKCIIQPNMLLAYSFIKTFDYKDNNGIEYNSDAVNIMHINPGVKFIANLKGNYQPYIATNIVWNIMNDAKFKANDITIPMVSVKPYIEYGVGLQKKFGERFTGYFQSMVRSGGRNGISLQFGFKWAI